MSKLTRKVFIVASKRTAFGTFGGSLKSWSPTELGVVAGKSALESGSIDPAIIDSVVMGNVAQTNGDTAYLARHVGLGCGVPVEKPMLTINRLCGSGFQSIVTACQEIMLGESNVVMTGGCESMSQAPYAVRNTRWGTPLGVNPPMVDTLWETLTDNYCKLPMAMTAENLAEKYDLSKEECDEFAATSQQRWAQANEAGKFSQEIAPITLKSKKGEKVFDTDEHPRPGSTAESVGKLPALFKKVGGTVSAGNASGISDGAGVVIVASEEAVKEHNLTPLAEIKAYAVAGVDPTIMGIGPVPAIQKCLEAAGESSINDMDLIEINEAFAPQALACAKELGIDQEKLNVNGGAIAIGHPTGASGSRIMGHLAYELGATGKKKAIGSACIGGGQGIAIMIENVQ